RESAASPCSAVSRCCSSWSATLRLAGAVVIGTGCHQPPGGRVNVRLLPGNDQAVLLAEALQVPAGHVLHPVKRPGVIGVGPHDQGIGLDGERRAPAEPPPEHRARRLLDDLDLVAEMAGELLAVSLAALGHDTRR